MKKWLAERKTVWWILIPCIPLIIACVGYLLIFSEPTLPADQAKPLPALLNALYSAFRIYGVSVDSQGTISRSGPGAILLEIARWMALIVSASVIIELFRMALLRIRISLRAMRKNAVALHGDEAPLNMLKKELGTRAIAEDIPEKFRARTHIFAFEKEASLYRYLNGHYTNIAASKDSRLYLCTLDATRSSYRDGLVAVCNIAENCARSYWRHHWLKEEETKIVLIGFDRYGQSLLKQALLTNVFARSRELEYHIYGDSGDFARLHPGIAHFAAVNGREPGRDALFFHNESWKDDLETLRGAHRILLCSNSDEENMQTLDQLLEYGIGRRLDVRSRHREVIQMLWPKGLRGPAEVNVFGTDDQLYTTDAIIGQALLKSAKLLHARYLRAVRQSGGACGSCGKMPGQCIGCETFSKDWNGLSLFLQDSNIAQADHMPVKIREVLKENVPDAQENVKRYVRQYAELTPGEQKKLWAMEHERWCRFLYFHGWEYASVRDNALKKHPLLVPFSQLPEKEWEKDASAFEAIAEIFAMQGAKKDDPQVEAGTRQYQRRKIAG